MADFRPFAKLVYDQFARMSANELFVVGHDSRAFERHYLQSFPPGTDPVYLERTEHDCNCCKSFIRHLGRVVAIVNGKIVTPWDIKGAEEPYQTVADKMAEFVRAQPVTNLFRSNQSAYGNERTLQAMAGGTIKNWNHFYGSVAKRHKTDQVDAECGAYRGKVDTARRALTELDIGSIDTVRDLINGKSLYRGEEHLASVESFRKAKVEFDSIADTRQRELSLWTAAGTSTAGHFRSSVIGTLVTALAEGTDLEAAVRSFEAKVAPTNYKRPTSLITPAMVKSAMKTIADLDLEPALQRRFAKIGDVNVNNVLWVDNDSRKKMRGAIESILMDATITKADPNPKAEEILIDDFMSTVLPNTTSMSVLFSGNHVGNLVSLTAPMHENSGKLFKWTNDFGWSYNGNITDSIKEKVKRAGGNVTNAALRVSLQWFNFDDLDIHVVEPNGNKIYYGNKCGRLDVDMNAGGGRTRDPVENVSWTSVPDGVYRVLVNQFSAREFADVGCIVEIENRGKITQLTYQNRLVGEVPFCSITMKGGQIVKIDPANGITAGTVSQDKWGIKTETYCKVQTLLASPNYWDDNAVGNKHWFFMIEGCHNPDPARGIYNEFLNSDLDKHRKVFEVLGDKTKCEPTTEQLSGLGFSSTRGDTVFVQVRGPKMNKTYEIIF